MKHIPVLTKEVLEYLGPEPNENFIDCTIGQAGHAKLILEKTAPSGRLLGIDLDVQQIENCKTELAGLKNRLVLVNDSYANLQKTVEKNKFFPVNGILLDMGFSSWHTDESKKGFSFQEDQPLDMRYSELSELTAEKIVNEWSEEKIAKILEEYGEEKFAEKIARKITEQRNPPAGGRKIESTFQLAEIVKDATPPAYWRGRIHYATRTFQALRIRVNDELENLKKVLPQAVSVLSPRGRFAVISFHSLEDRIVKSFFREQKKQNNIKILTKKPVTAREEEIKINPRSRSAKLRALIKI